MAIQGLDFRPIAQGGDNPTAAFVKLAANDADLDGRVSAAMPKTGGTFTGNLQIQQSLIATGTTLVLGATGAAGQIILRPTNSGSVQAILGANGAFGTTGGFGTAQGSNAFKIGWTGSAELYIDGTKIGNFAFATSDTRLKRDIVYVDSPEDGDADQKKVLAGRPVTWYQKATGIFGDDGIQRRSFLSPEMQDIDPILAPGDREAVTDDGGIIPLNLNNDAMVSVLWGALRREIQLRQALEERVAALELR